jgi:vesicle coat complex subunit
MIIETKGRIIINSKNNIGIYKTVEIDLQEKALTDCEIIDIDKCKDIFDNFESIKEIFNNEEDKQFLKLKDIITEYNKLSENKKSDNTLILEIVTINKIDEITYNAINCFIPNNFILDFKSKESNFLIYTNSEEVISDFRWISERGSFV